MRMAGCCAIVLTFGLASLSAQKPDQSIPDEVIWLGLQKTPARSLVIPPAWVWDPPSKRLFGGLTLVAPQTRSEIVRVAVPVGELTTQLARKVSNARHRRSERKARETVERDLRDFLAQQPPR
jgi:hypothetical protein